MRNNDDLDAVFNGEYDSQPVRKQEDLFIPDKRKTMPKHMQAWLPPAKPKPPPPKPKPKPKKRKAKKPEIKIPRVRLTPDQVKKELERWTKNLLIARKWVRRHRLALNRYKKQGRA